MGAPEVREALFLTGGYGGGEFKKHCWASMSDNLKKKETVVKHGGNQPLKTTAPRGGHGLCKQENELSS